MEDVKINDNTQNEYEYLDDADMMYITVAIPRYAFKVQINTDFVCPHESSEDECVTKFSTCTLEYDDIGDARRLFIMNTFDDLEYTDEKRAYVQMLEDREYEDYEDEDDG